MAINSHLAPIEDGSSLDAILAGRSRDDLLALATQTLKRVDIEHLNSQELREVITRELETAASHSLPWARPVPYANIVRMVAKRLKLPAPAKSTVSEIEKVILFRILEKSLENMSSDQKKELARRIESELESRGVKRKVAFSEVFDFVKFAGMDVGGTVGGLALAGPGIAGVVGLNFLQWIILQAVLMTSGHLAAAGALFGFGTAGALVAAAGWAGPIGAALALLYTGYVLAGPAFRKLIPAVCFIAAWRLEMDTKAKFKD